jgi:hypothetical protein
MPGHQSLAGLMARWPGLSVIFVQHDQIELQIRPSEGHLRFLIANKSKGVRCGPAGPTAGAALTPSLNPAIPAEGIQR